MPISKKILVKGVLMVLLFQHAPILLALLNPAIAGALPSGRILGDVISIWPHAINSSRGPFHGFSSAFRDLKDKVECSLERMKKLKGDKRDASAEESDALDDVEEDDDDEDEEEDETDRLIRLEEIQTALDEGIQYSQLSEEDLAARGWKLVHSGEKFSLHKRRLNDGKGAVVYLMMGGFDDVSARTFLHSQIDRSCRKEWDVTMAEMSEGEINSDSLTIKKSQRLSQPDRKSLLEDTLYYRTKWPWPLKDRDYALARRCKLFRKDDAIVFVSKSTKADQYPSKSGVLRVDNYWCHSVFFSTAVDKSKSHSPQVSGQYRNSNSGSSAAANGVEGGFAASGDGSSPTSFQSAGVSATAHQQKFHSNAIVTSEPRDTIRLVHRLHSLFPTPYSATTVAASATANRAVVAVATAGLYRDQLYRLPQSSRDVFATLHERYHPKHLIKANMLANLRRAELKRQKEHAQEHQYTVQRQTALQPESYASIRPSVKQPRGSFFRRSFFLMRFGNTDAQRTDAFPGRVKRVSSKMGCSDLPEVSMGQHYSLHNTPRDRVDGHQSGEEDVGAPLGAANTAASKIRNIDRPGMRFVTIFCDDQKVPLPTAVVDILSKHAEKLVPDSVERLHAVASRYQSLLPSSQPPHSPPLLPTSPPQQQQQQQQHAAAAAA